MAPIANGNAHYSFEVHFYSLVNKLLTIPLAPANFKAKSFADRLVFEGIKGNIELLLAVCFQATANQFKPYKNKQRS